MFLSKSRGRKAAGDRGRGARVRLPLRSEHPGFPPVSADPRADDRSSGIPKPGARSTFTATAYCKGTTTASGVNVRHGIAAADPQVLPVGSVIRVEKLADRYNGIYTVMDTGPKVQGRHVDIYLWSCNEALATGPTACRLLPSLRLGWNPQASSRRWSTGCSGSGKEAGHRLTLAADNSQRPTANSQLPTPNVQRRPSQFALDVRSWELEVVSSRYCNSNSL